MSISDEEFNDVRAYVKLLTGITLSDSKQYLVEQRLGSFLRKYDCETFNALIEKTKKDFSGKMREELIAAMTTNETSFFRDLNYFDSIKHIVLPKLCDLIRKRKRTHDRKGPRVNIWSAASSTGQEAYSMSIMIHEFLKNSPQLNVDIHDFDIVASDISAEVLSKAMMGIYHEVEIKRGLDTDFIEKYFDKVDDSNWKAKEEVKRIVSFRSQNLLHSFASFPGFDVILCRNVLIYFDDATVKSILTRMRKQLSNDGFLILGSAESIDDPSLPFKLFEESKSRIYIPRVA